MISFRISDQGLTARTDEGTGAASVDLFNTITADRAGLPLAVTDQNILHFESAFLTIQVGLVKRTAFGQAWFEPLVNSSVKMRDIIVCKSIIFSQRMQTGEEENIVDVSITDTCHAGLVE